MKYSKSKSLSWMFTALLMLFTPLSNAQIAQPHTLIFNDNEIDASITLPGAIEVDVKIEFENAVGVNPANFDIYAELLLPTDPSITNRLPSGLVSATSGFPVIVTVAPKSDAGFAFEGAAMVELYTKALHFAPDLRLFTSHAGDTFEDITMLTAAGSIRSRGNTGRFSDFMILVDARAPADVIELKLNDIDDYIYENSASISSVLQPSISLALSTLANDITLGNYTAALLIIDDLIELVDSTDDEDMPTIWRSSDDLTNVKGELLTKLNTLRFSLRTL